MTTDQHLFLDTNGTYIRNEIIVAGLRAIDSEFSEELRVSLITDQSNDCWECKLTSKRKVRRLNLGPEHQDMNGIQQGLRKLKEHIG